MRARHIVEHLSMLFQFEMAESITVSTEMFMNHYLNSLAGLMNKQYKSFPQKTHWWLENCRIRPMARLDEKSFVMFSFSASSLPN